MYSFWSDPNLSHYIALGVLALLCAFFAATETSLFVLSPLDRLRLREKNQVRGERVEAVLIRPRRLLVTLNDSSQEAPDPWGLEHTYVHAIPDRFTAATAFDLPFSQFWRRDNLIDDGDRVQAMWGSWYSASQPGDSDITIGGDGAYDVIGQ